MDLRLTSRLFLLLILGVIASHELAQYRNAPITGVHVYLPHVCTADEARHMGDGRPIWVRLFPDAVTYINNQPIRQDDLVRVTGQAMDTRQERELYLVGNENLAYGDVVPWVSAMQKRSPGLAVLLTTPAQERALGPFRCVVMNAPQLAPSPTTDWLTTFPVH